MSVSVERLREVNKRLKEKLAQRESGEAQFTIDAKNLVDSSSVESVNKKLLDKIPPSLAKTIEIDETSDRARLQNLVKLLELYRKLEINKKAPELDKLFIYKAMNISGIGLKEEDFGEIREGKYVQIIAITYEPDKSGKKKAKNISLGYFGKAETLSKDFKNEIIEFVLRWRYEKAFQNLKHYKVLLSRLK
ncbi:MAG: hypothetical protein GXN91_00330 [Epsilonproteobacteria bacterium]|nr:hypothetical protein [Campylobacterota bacterium]